MNFLNRIRHWLREARTVDADHLARNAEEGLISQKVLATVVGLVALGLPYALWGIDQLNGRFCVRASLSHYYYAPGAGDAFVLALAIVGVVLVAYRGENRIDARMATVAGLAAFLVALFPTSGLGCEEAAITEIRGIWVRDSSGEFSEHMLPTWFATVHYGSAAIVLIVLTYFAGWSFRRVLPNRDMTSMNAMTWRKRVRNLTYSGCAAAMVAGLLMFGLDLAGFRSFPWSPRAAYWAEWLILTAFGISWFVKGNRVFGLLADAGDTTKAVRSSETGPD